MRNLRSTPLLLLLLLVAVPFTADPRAQAAPVTTGQPVPATQPPVTVQVPEQLPRAESPNSYTVGPSDVLKILVFGEDSLSGTFRVDENGSISYAILGRIPVAGKTEREIAVILEKLLGDGFVNRPQVAVQVEQFRSRSIFIMGEVRTAGKYPLQGDNTLLEVLAMAGSLTTNASTDVVVLRPRTAEGRDAPTLPEDTSSLVMRIDLQAIEQGRMSGNIQLQDGDTVFVPKAEKFYITGHVRSPGQFALTKGMTLQQAIAVAGGLTDRGSTRRIKVRRETAPGSGLFKEATIKMTDVVMPNDTIVIPPRLI